MRPAFPYLLVAGMVLAVLAVLAAGSQRPDRAEALGGPTTISAGRNHTCTVTSTGAAKCWGRNKVGELGDGTNTVSPLPVDVVGLQSGVVSISAGLAHTCAVTSSGGVKCWGDNTSGQLGDGTTITRNVPVDVVGLSDAIAISAGGAHSCAVTSGGGIKCWGNNGSGQLGDNRQCNTPCTMPIDVVDMASGAAAVAAGDLHTCALSKGGTVKCWGLNLSGQLGDGTTTTTRLTPATVSGLDSGGTAVAAGGEHSCAIVNGGAKCWGDNSSAQLGDGTLTARNTPVDVTGLLSGVARIDANSTSTCAVKTSGGAKCWGSGLFGGATPSDVTGLTSGVAGIDVGGSHGCAITTSGVPKCWGSALWGQLGDGTIWFRNTPVQVASLTSTPVSIAAGDHHTCAITATGAAKCWGANGSGQVGDGTTSERITPVDVSGLGIGTTAMIAAGDARSCAVTLSGDAKCWGAAYLGDGSPGGSTIPVNVSGLTGSTDSIATGAIHACAATITGGAKCWGDNASGQLGDGTTVTALSPVDVAGLTSGVIAIAAADRHSCALTSSGGVKCWGENNSGELGDGTFADSLVAVDASGLTSGVASIAAGGNESCAVTASGDVYCWGNGVSTPALRTLPGPAVSVATSESHRCALLQSGTVMCWGNGSLGQLGNGLGDPSGPYFSATPVAVLNLSGAVSVVTGGGTHSCAAVAGGMDCWGSNFSGELGDGTGGARPLPVDVFETISKVPPAPTALPTATPCPGGTCPTPTNTPIPSPTPTAPTPTGLDFSIAVDVDGDGSNDCETESGPSACDIPLGETFEVRVYLNGLPIGVPAYDGFEVRLTYAGVTAKNTGTPQPWPPCAFAGSAQFAGGIQFGCVIGVGAPSATYLGLIGLAEFSCVASGTIDLVHESGATAIIGPLLASHYEVLGARETLQINCAEGPPPPPPPAPVGGISRAPRLG